MNGSGSGCAFCLICRLSAIIRVVFQTPSCTVLWRAARKSSTGRTKATHEGFDFCWNKPGILLMEKVKGVIGQCTIYSEPVAPISMVGINKGWDFWIENAVSGALLRRGPFFFSTARRINLFCHWVSEQFSAPRRRILTAKTSVIGPSNCPRNGGLNHPMFFGQNA